MTETEQELFERCFTLEGIRFGLEDKIESILDYLVKTHITVEELEKLQELVYDK